MIARAAPAIFAALTNFGPGSPWYTQVAQAQVEPSGPVGQGSRITQLHIDGGRREETRYLVERFQLDHALCLKSVDVKPASTINYELKEDASRTRLSCSIQVQTGGLLRLVESRLRSDLDRKLEKTLDQFKETMERG